MSLHMLGASVLSDRGGAVAAVTVSPSTPSIKMGERQQFTAVATDASGKSFAAPVVSWSVSGAGAVDPSGVFTPTGPGTAVVRARVGIVTGQTSVEVVESTSAATDPRARHSRSAAASSPASS